MSNAQSVTRRLEQLDQTADQALAGLKADQHLMLRIEKTAMQPQKEQPRRKGWVPALACAMALVVCFALAVPAMQPDTKPLLTAQSAGDKSISAERALNMPEDDVSITRGTAAPAYRSLWEQGSGTFPLVGVNGKYYRMLTSPTKVDSSLLGSSLGAVAEFTTEPSLSGTDVLLSNAADLGTEIFEVKGMGDTLVATTVNGTMRLFQRVSFNGSALRGGEELADTLQISGSIRAMELSDVGVVTDTDACEALFQTLLDNASYESSGTVNARQSLLIELDNGVTVQMAVRDESLSACGTWSCPEFFEAFEEAMD